jgi:hypothetical protein
MANMIPNQNSFVGFIASAALKPFGTTATGAPTLAEINGATDLTDFIVSINASATGNTVPTPRLKSLFETSVPGTSSATFTADMYRDDEADDAWDALPRGTRGTFIIQRFGGTGPDNRPAATQVTEVWPIQVVSRAASAMQSGQAETFTLTCSVPIEPVEDYVTPAT